MSTLRMNSRGLGLVAALAVAGSTGACKTVSPEDMDASLATLRAEMQQEMAELQVEGSAGGGMVTAAMSGSKELLSLTIDPEAVDPEDVEMLQDLVLAAVNEATRKVDEAMQDQLGGMAGALGGGLPGL